LQSLLREGHAESFDFAFIDADKQRYDTYYELVLKLLRRGGVAVLDNMLWSGHVADESKNDADTTALRRLNLKIRDDERVDGALVAIRDGVQLVRKR
jgi:caffeoyl-CoA O-methyltransferase